VMSYLSPEFLSREDTQWTHFADLGVGLGMKPFVF